MWQYIHWGFLRFWGQYIYPPSFPFQVALGNEVTRGAIGRAILMRDARDLPARCQGGLRMDVGMEHLHPLHLPMARPLAARCFAHKFDDTSFPLICQWPGTRTAGLTRKYPLGAVALSFLAAWRFCAKWPGRGRGPQITQMTPMGGGEDFTLRREDAKPCGKHGGRWAGPR